MLLAVCAFLLLPAGAAAAHPLGNFTVNRYDGLVVSPGRLSVHHVEDLAEIPAAQAGPRIARLGRAAWARGRCADAARRSRLTVADRRVPLRTGTSAVRTRPGQAGLGTLRVECRWTAALPAGSVALSWRAAVDDGPGWRETTARGDRTTLTSSDVPERSVSRELTRYPEELLSSPADTASAALRARPGGPALAESRPDAPASAVLPRGADRFTRALDGLVARKDLSAGFAALALVVAVVLGALHAVAPGHGKTVMAATAAARGRASLRDVLPLAASVTVTHTLGVIALGVLVTAGSAAAPSVIAWLGVASGLLVTLAGTALLRGAWRRRTAAPHEHGHPHDSRHGHEHGPAHEHSHEHGHSHPHPHDRDPRHGRPRPHDHDPRHGHSPTPRPTLKGTLLLGFAGGLVPSPSAVVVLVGAAALGRAWFGLLLVLAYGAGLALTLTAAGFAVVRAGGRLARALEGGARWSGGRTAAVVRRTVPLGSALAVVALGAGLVFRGAASALG
ncbi:HoxN/HupN/NixA family nickel/cobalt transporter [Streptomyces minutiscleroticus]|uniref:HoxN/HupN/NixA family nickel/cobalt transporter n=1 Tax=Streptomyces minutiscleroticus TaxID=68238 RepID=UPI001E326227|nr:nickel transporter [Streptomyces minutiscleroticus]